MKKIPHLNAMTHAQLASELSGDHNGGWVNVPGPGHSKKDRSLGIRLNPSARDGFVVNSLAGDDPEECRRHVKTQLAAVSLAEAKKTEMLSLTANTDQTDAQNVSVEIARRRDLALKVWSERSKICGTAAEAYLAARGLSDVSKLAEQADLGFHAVCPLGTVRVPVLLGLVTHAVTGEQIGVHRTALRDDGQGKRTMHDGGPPKRMLGASKEGVIRLSPFEKCLGIAEGVETALAAAELFGLPVWAALSANGIADLPIIPGVKFLRILADHDKAGIAAARKCRRRYKEAGVKVEIRYPPKCGDDWNDYLRQKTKEAAHGD